MSMKINPTLCIYHGNCADGFGAAWAVWKKFPHIKFHPGVYGQEAPDVTAHDVVMVDFSYPREVLARMLTQANSITVIDHHKTAQEFIQPLLETTAIHGIFDLSKSGAVLAWEWFHEGTEVPEILLHIQDRDLWKFLLPGTREIQANLFSYAYDFEIWDDLILNTSKDEHFKQGLAIERKHFKDVAELNEVSKRRMKIGGRWVWVSNLPYTLASDACHALAETPMYPQESGEIDGSNPKFGASYFDRGDGKRVFSLRSVGSFDVSEIAKLYGGGGHKNAAGFTVDIGWEGDQ